MRAFPQLVRLLPLLLAILLLHPQGASCEQSMFDPAGRLTQLESADKAARRGATVAALRSSSCAVLVTWRPDSVAASSSLHTRRTPLYALRALSPSVGFTAVGVASDCAFVAALLYRHKRQVMLTLTLTLTLTLNRNITKSQSTPGPNQHKEEFGTEPHPARLAATLADALHLRTRTRALRPLGIRACIVGWVAGGARLLEVRGGEGGCSLSAGQEGWGG